MKKKLLMANLENSKQLLENSKVFTIRKVQCLRSLSVNGEIAKTDKETAEVFHNFFGNIVKNLDISQYSDFDPIIENVKDAPVTAP